MQVHRWNICLTIVFNSSENTFEILVNGKIENLYSSHETMTERRDLNISSQKVDANHISNQWNEHKLSSVTLIYDWSTCTPTFCYERAEVNQDWHLLVPRCDSFFLCEQTLTWGSPAQLEGCKILL